MSSVAHPSRSAVAAVFLDRRGRLLCVKPTYREGWLVPGGMIETRESPQEACRREIREEIGLDIPVGRLLCIEPRRDGSAQYVFWGGELSDAQVAAIALPPEELSEHRFAAFDEAREILVPSLMRRIRRALTFRASRRTPGTSS